MLKSLHISNYALINELSINFNEGMTVLTGETGAGKSIIVGALSLAMGQRADTKAIKEGERKAVVEVCFDIKNYDLHSFFDENDFDYSDITFIRREILNNGKSRAFINDTPTQLVLLRKLSGKLLDIHSQHENLLLATEDYQLKLVDVIANNSRELSTYRLAFNAWKSAKSQLQKLKKYAEKQSSDLDYMLFQLNQLDEAKLIENEQAELEAELETLSHVEEIKTELQLVDFKLESDENSILSALHECRNALRKIKSYLPESEEWEQRLDEALIELKDISNSVISAQQKIEFNPERLEFVDNRLGTIISLQKKFKVDSIKELIELQENFRKQVNRITNMDEELLVAEKEVKRCAEILKSETEKLTASRKKAVPFIEKQLIEKLLHLGMPDIQFKVEIANSSDYSSTGRDIVTFLFSANKNRSMQPVSEIASGGEISRLMLAIKSMMVSKSDLPTIVFDEIDTGVSGDIAGRMGEIMKSMSKNSQVIAITHLPQIAGKGTDHFKVYKKNIASETQTFIQRLNTEERVKEIAQMLSSKHITEAALMNARELMK
ncbi:MAG: DNA repair protein RecN [Bacteroidales bacterium]|nr:DNA repair protein RecN [Bacteroidales bacterium]